MPIDQILGWIGNAGFFFGAIWVARKRVFGWYLQLLANFLYIYQGYILQNYSLMWLSIVLGGVNVYGIYAWQFKKAK